ncbi:hypothetical protein J4E89_005819 [Alternaria sp. Ai002NY15]|nr:hypothetical protein J4E89_005819 [Alternaria sp. Ai002NY15]
MQSKDKTYAPSSGQVAEEPSKLSVSVNIELALERCKVDFKELLKKLNLAKELANKQIHETPPCEAIEAPHPSISGPLTVAEAQHIIERAPPEEIDRQRFVLRGWAERNEDYLQDSYRVEGKLVKFKNSEKESAWKSHQRERISHARSVVLQVLYLISLSLTDMRRIAEGRKKWGGKWGPESAWDREVLKLRHKTNDLSRYNDILELLTETVGDKGPDESGAYAHTSGYSNVDYVRLDQELRDKKVAKQDACTDVESTDSESDEEAAKSEYLRTTMLGRTLKGIMPGSSTKGQGERPS